MTVHTDTERAIVIAKSPSNWMMFVEFPAATSLFIVASLNLAYRPLWLILPGSALLFAAFRAYLQQRYGIQVPAVVLLLAFAAVGIDTTGHTDWVTLQISTRRRIVVPEVVVIVPCFLIEVLAGKS